MYCVILITAKDVQQARKIGKQLVADKLAACVNIIEKIESLFWWEGKVCAEKEALMVIKTRRDRVKKLIKAVKSWHSYSVPEIIALPIAEGSGDYLKWISDSVSR